MSKKDDSSKAGIAGAIAGVAAAAAGLVYFYGPKGDKRRKKLKGWMLKVKGEVLTRLEEAEELSKEKYDEIVDKAIDSYRDAKDASEKELDELKERLKGEWEHIKQVAQEKGEELKEVAQDELAKQRKNAAKKVDPDA